MGWVLEPGEGAGHRPWVAGAWGWGVGKGGGLCRDVHPIPPFSRSLASPCCRRCCTWLEHSDGTIRPLPVTQCHAGSRKMRIRWADALDRLFAAFEATARNEVKQGRGPQ